MEKLVYQMFISGCEGKDCLEKALAKGLGGVIFFTKDIDSAEQFRALISDIKSKSLISPFLSIDQEGGRVERTEKIHERYLSQRFAFQKGKEFLIEQSEKIAEELKSYGINLNFSPCIDVNTNPNNPIIGERAFSDNPFEVIEGGKFVADALRKKGVIPCIKHFPGHGDADKDSHLTLPEIRLSLEEMKKTHILPFKSLIDDGIEMVMAAHLHCKCFDKDVVPASLSKNAIGYLRNNLNYDGVVITDDMVMKGVQDFGTLEAMKMAISAGVDMFIFRDIDKNLVETIDFLVQYVEKDETLKQKVLKANERIKSLKLRYLDIH